MMNKNVMKKWVKALRSGAYKRGEGLLKQLSCGKVHHCCLGVLCELYNDEMRAKKKKTLKETEKDGIYRFDDRPENLPIKVKEWGGLNNQTGAFSEDTVLKTKKNEYGRYISLADMNDLGCSFEKIADTVEKEWENI
jgi:hypothetical protein